MAFVALEVAKKLASQSQIDVMRSKMARMIIRPKNMKTQVRRGVSSRVGERKGEIYHLYKSVSVLFALPFPNIPKY